MKEENISSWVRLTEDNVKLIFERGSLAYASSIPVHDDTGK